MNIVRLLASAVLGYLLGNIQTGLIVGWTTKKIDLRQHGSGSSGATNALRILGRQSALWTLLGDFRRLSGPAHRRLARRAAGRHVRGGGPYMAGLLRL